MKALIVIDVQEGLFKKGKGVYHGEQLLGNIALLIEKANRARAPVVMFRHCNNTFLKKGSDGWQIHHAIVPPPDCLLIDKDHASCFHNTNLDSRLEERRITSVVLSGLVTHGCVRASCLDGISRGYAVTLVADAHSGYSRDAASLITLWNDKLESEGAILNEAQDVRFD